MLTSNKCGDVTTHRFDYPWSSRRRCCITRARPTPIVNIRAATWERRNA